MLINSLIKFLWTAVRSEMHLDKGTTFWNKCSDKSWCTRQPLESSKVKQRAAEAFVDSPNSPCRLLCCCWWSSFPSRLRKTLKIPHYLLQAPQTWPLLCTALLSPCQPTRHGEVPLDRIIHRDGCPSSPDRECQCLPVQVICATVWLGRRKSRVRPRSSARRFTTLCKCGAWIPREAPGSPHPLGRGLHLYFWMKRSKRNSGSAFKHLSKSFCWAGVVQPSLPPPAATNST